MIETKTRGGIFERPRKSGFFWIDYYDAEGKRHKEKIGRKSEALQALTRRHKEIADGMYISPARAALPFRDLAHAALEYKRLRLAPQSYKSDRLRLGRILPFIGSVPAEQLTPEQLERAFAKLIDGGICGSTANRYRSLISSIYSFALRTGRLKTNPVARVKKFKENESRLRYLLADEEVRLRKYIREHYPQNEDEFDLALYTGMRRGEQFTLKWKDVSLERGVATVRGKTGRRHVVLNSTAKAAIERIHDRCEKDAHGNPVNEYVCPETTNEVQRDWRRWLEKSAESAGVKDFHWHDLRHTFASRLVMAGADIRAVQQLLGHKSIVMTMKYAHLSPDHTAEAAEKISRSA
jgi:site-specific recombinase XerD